MVTDFESEKPITAMNYSDLIDDINTIYGTGTGDSGYGGNSANVVSAAVDLPSFALGEIVNNEEWLDLTNAFNDCALHQDTTLPNTLPLLTNLEDGDEVGFGTNAAPLFESLNGTPPNNVTELTTNKLNSDISNFSTTTILSSVRSTAWGTGAGITHEFTATFDDSDHARFFFNTGGEFRITGSRTGGAASAQNQSWTNLLSGSSPIVFAGTDYFSLTGSYVIKSTVYAATTTTYANPAAIDAEKNKWVISARRDDAAGINGGNGSIIRIKCEFIDGFTGPTQDALGLPGNPVGGLADGVDGILTSAISQKRSIGIFNITSAVFVNIVEL